MIEVEIVQHIISTLVNLSSIVALQLTHCAILLQVMISLFIKCTQ
jgi:hypothetical protein